MSGIVPWSSLEESRECQGRSEGPWGDESISSGSEWVIRGVDGSLEVVEEEER